MKLTLVRHTRLDIAPGICYGQSDVPVANTFEEEARKVKQQLKDREFSYIFSSPLSRCTQLAAFCGYEQSITDARLKELHFGDWEMMPWNDIRGEYAEKWMKEYYSTPCLNGESLNDLIDRIQLFLIDLRQSGWDNLLLFTHGGPIRVILHLLNGLKKEELFSRPVDYGEVIEI